MADPNLPPPPADDGPIQVAAAPNDQAPGQQAPAQDQAPGAQAPAGEQAVDVHDPPPPPPVQVDEVNFYILEFSFSFLYF